MIERLQVKKCDSFLNFPVLFLGFTLLFLVFSVVFTFNFHRFFLFRDTQGYLDHRRTHLWVLDIDEDGDPASNPFSLTAGPFDCTDPAWSPDSRRVAFICNRTVDTDANSEEHLYVVAADNAADAQLGLIQVSFQWTNPDFLLKNPDFRLRNPDFLLKNG